MKYKEELQKFYKGRKVFITGHTGFKGSWMCELLTLLGAEVTGYALEAPTNPALFDVLGLDSKVNNVVGDVRDLEKLQSAMAAAEPEIVIHMAAQPIVRESYKNPVYTYETNVMGTVNVLEAIRNTASVKSVVNVTTDKVYLNREWQWGYRENEELNGYDPYSNSKSCSELVTSSYKNSFFCEESSPAISTCRAGNVIGGGDFAPDRIIPDCVRAAEKGENIVVRNPYSTRPYQHVLEPVVAYLMIAMKQYEDKTLASAYNIGPDDTDCWTTGRIVDAFINSWNELAGANLSWENKHDGGPHEANFLKLDCSKVKTTFDWSPVWDVDTAIEKICEWSKAYMDDGSVENMTRVTDKHILEYLS